MVKAVRFDKTGGPEVMKWVDVEVGEPGNCEIRIKQHAVGLNYIDVYVRTGSYPLPLPLLLWWIHSNPSPACDSWCCSRARRRRLAVRLRLPAAWFHS